MQQASRFWQQGYRFMRGVTPPVVQSHVPNTPDNLPQQCSVMGTPAALAWNMEANATMPAE